MDSAGMEDLLSFLGEFICMLYVCHMTDICFLTESVTGWTVGIDLVEGCLGAEFNLLTVLRGGAGHGRSEWSDGTESLGTISHARSVIRWWTPRRWTPPTSLPPRRRTPRQRTPRQRGPPAHSSPHRRRPHPRQGAKEESARAAVANKSCCA